MHPTLLGTEVEWARNLQRGRKGTGIATSSHKPDLLSPRTGGLPKAAFGNQEMIVRAPCTGLSCIVCGTKRFEHLDVHQDECFINSYTQELQPECIFWVQKAGMQLVVPSHQADAV